MKGKNLFILLILMALSPLSLYGQISLKMSDVTVQDAMTALNNTAGYSIVVKTSAVDMNKLISVTAVNSTVENVLDQIFAGQDISYSIDGYNIIVRKKEIQKADPVRPLCVKGRVLDAQGEVLPGAGVMVKGTSTGIISGIDGSFEIEVPGFPVELEFSFVGYDTEVVSVGGIASSPLTVVMNESRLFLEETVVVGYATMKKRDLVGAVDMVSSDVLDSRPTANVATALQGQVAGLNITFPDSKPSRSANMNVRGASSIGSGGSALILIDGVEGALSDVNPQDVASISVLKDASSAAIYGARGAFGVILITTKNPQRGTPVISYNASVSANRRTVIPDFVTDGLSWVDWWKECYDGYYNGSKALPNHIDSTVPYSEAIYQELVQRSSDPTLTSVSSLSGHSLFGWAYYESTDWMDLFYKDVNFTNEHNVSVSGGNENADYYISGRYYGQDGIYKVGDENYQRMDLRAKGTLKVRPWFKVTNNISLSSIDQYEPKHSRNNFSVQRAMNHAAMPLSPVKNPDGSWTTAAAISGYAAFSEGTSYRKSNALVIREKISADIDIIPEVLVASADYSANFTIRERMDVQIPVKYSKIPGITLLESESAGESLQQRNYDTRYSSANAYLTFSPRLGDKHSLTALAGWNLEQQKYKTTTIERTNFITATKTDSFTLMDGVSSDPVTGGNAWSYVGFFGRLNYSFKGRYLLELSGRYDGSSKFPTASKWGFFPSASIGWRLSDEPWMDWMKPVVNNAKLRASAGSMGNGNVSPYSYTSEMSISTASDFLIGGAYPSYTSVGGTVPVSLTWETSTTYDAGLDLDMLGSRLSLSGDYYRRYTTDMYTQSVDLPAVYGTAPPKGNNASMRTDGWEVSLQWRDEFKLGGKPFSYSVKASLWDFKSVITSYANDTGTLGTIKAFIQNGGSPSSYYVGMTLGEIWGYGVDGLFKDYEDIASSAIQNFKQASDKITRPGQVKFVDRNDDGEISYGNFQVYDHGDLFILGNKNPRYLYGLNLSANWNGIGLSVFLQGVGRRDWYPGADSGFFWGKYGRPFFAFIPTIHTDASTVYSEELNNWDTAYWPRKTTYQSNGSYDGTTVLEMPNTRYIQNAAYLRVKNVQVDYTFSKKVCEAIGMKGLRFYLSGENLLTFTPLHKYAPNYDPEALTYDTDFASAGDGYTYPILKSLTLGLNITF